jgi:glutathione synthase/RimK-type ligase-like ATP-grasp enzyme
MHSPRPLRVALATCAAHPGLDNDSCLLLPALARAGMTPRCLVWDDASAPWHEMDIVLVRSTWDYWTEPGRREAFVAWSARVGAVVPLWNDPEVIRWNTHKAYLRELSARGATIVPTLWLAEGEGASGLARRVLERGWEHVVIKPAVSAGSIGALRIDVSRDPTAAEAHAATLARQGEVMIQPYLSSIEEEGELSVIVIDGAVAHAVRKVPRGGEYRSQPEFGSAISRLALTDEVSAAVKTTLAASGRQFLYARVDLVRGPGGALHLIELEVTEPSLYLRWNDNTVDMFVEAIARVAASGPRGIEHIS